MVINHNSPRRIIPAAVAVVFSFFSIFKIEFDSHPDHNVYLRLYFNFLSNDQLPFYDYGIALYFKLVTFFNGGAASEISTAYLINIIFCGFLLMIIAHQKGISSVGFMVYLSIFWFLLSTILLRAGPAYLLGLLAVVIYRKSAYLAFLLSLLAIFFHITSIVVPLAFIFARFLNVARINHWIVFFSSAIIYIGMIFHRSEILEVFMFIAGFLNLLGAQKYVVYLEAVSQVGFMHRIYFFTVFVFFALFLHFGSEGREVKMIVCFLLFISVIFGINHVAAFRFSPYFLGPILLFFPFQKFGHVFQIICIFFSISLFSYFYLNGMRII